VAIGSNSPLENSLLILKRSDRARINFIDKDMNPDYIITNYRGTLADYSKIKLGTFSTFYQIIVDNEVILTIYKNIINK
jgi:hypothetical protein